MTLAKEMSVGPDFLLNSYKRCEKAEEHMHARLKSAGKLTFGKLAGGEEMIW